MVQADSSDARVPRSILRGKAGQRGWASPALPVLIAPRGYEVAIKAGKIRPIFSLGIQLPYYFRGDSFEAMAGIFTSKRSDFAKSGRCSWGLSASIPLLAARPKN